MGRKITSTDALSREIVAAGATWRSCAKARHVGGFNPSCLLEATITISYSISSHFLGFQCIKRWAIVIFLIGNLNDKSFNFCCLESVIRHDGGTKEDNVHIIKEKEKDKSEWSTSTPAHQSTSQTSWSHNNSATTLLILLYRLLDKGRIVKKHVACRKPKKIIRTKKLKESTAYILFSCKQFQSGRLIDSIHLDDLVPE